MEFTTSAIVIIALSAVVVLLQVISLISMAGLRKKVAELAEARTPAPSAPADRNERKNGDFRRQGQERRPQQEQRTPRPQQAAAPVVAADPVEKSLRDINMKLKHAERDQEFARKKLQENLQTRGNDQRGERGERSERGERGDRSERGDRGERSERGDRGRGRGGDRDRSRGNRDSRGERGDRGGNRRDNWQDRDRNRQGSFQQSSTPETTDADQENREVGMVPPSEIRPAVQETMAADQGTGASDFSEENLQHGRKIIVKRRPLRDEAGSDQTAEETPMTTPPESFAPDAQESAPEAASAPAPEAQAPAARSEESAPEEEPTEVHFGRRKS